MMFNRSVSSMIHSAATQGIPFNNPPGNPTKTPSTKCPSRLWLWGQCPHRRRSSDSGPPGAFPLGQELHWESLEPRGMGKTEQGGKEMASGRSGPGLLRAKTKTAASDGWEVWKVSCGRPAGQCSKVITPADHCSDTSLKEVSSRRKNVAPMFWTLNQGWEYNQGCKLHFLHWYEASKKV